MPIGPATYTHLSQQGGVLEGLGTAIQTLMHKQGLWCLLG